MVNAEVAKLFIRKAQTYPKEGQRAPVLFSLPSSPQVKIPELEIVTYADCPTPSFAKKIIEELEEAEKQTRTTLSKSESYPAFARQIEQNIATLKKELPQKVARVVAALPSGSELSASNVFFLLKDEFDPMITQSELMPLISKEIEALVPVPHQYQEFLKGQIGHEYKDPDKLESTVVVCHPRSEKISIGGRRRQALYCAKWDDEVPGIKFFVCLDTTPYQFQEMYPSDGITAHNGVDRAVPTSDTLQRLEAMNALKKIFR